MKRTKSSEKKDRLVILTNDPSLTAWGYAVIDASTDSIWAQGCIETKPNSKTNRIRKGDDRVRRIHELNIELLNIIRAYDVNFIISELPHGSQNAAAAFMVGMCADKVQTIGDCLGIPVEWYSENDAKSHVFGKKKITKEDMVNRMNELYEVDWLGSKAKNSGLADAIAIYHVAKDYSQIIQFYKNR